MKVKGKAKFSFIGMVLMLSAGMLTGCEVTYPDMTQEEQEHVVEYAAKLILEYNKNHEYSLAKLEDQESENITSEPEEEESAGLPESNSELPVETPEQSDTVDMPKPKSLTDILAIEGFHFQYVGSLIADSYPTEVANGEVSFVVNAIDDTKLLVLQFDVTNYSGSDYYLDMTQRNVSFKVGWNGRKAQDAFLTMLANDMASYRGNIPEGQTVQMVVVCEVPAESASTISNIEFLVNDREGTDITTF